MEAPKVRCTFTQLVPLADLKPHPKNRNKHPKAQISRLAEIFEYQGIRHPIVVSRLSGFIVAGHGRLEAAQKAGLTEFPVDYQEFASEEQEYAFLISDNAAALWAELDLSGINTDLPDLGPDFNIDLLGIKNFTIDVAEKEEEESNWEDFKPAEPKTRLGDIYCLGAHRLLCGDATSITAVDTLLAGQVPDMVFTDPPYGISVKMNQKDTTCRDTILGDETTQVAVDAFNLCSAFKIPMIFWGANHYAFDARLPNAKCWIAWNKQERNNHIDQADCELAWTNINSPARQFHHLWAGFRRDSEKGETRVHPTQKPVELIVEILEHFKKHAGNKILDLFGRSGSTLIACEKTKRTAYLMELDPKYCDVIVARWEKFTGQKAELMNGSSAQEG